MAKSKKPSATQVLREIHDILYLEADGHNGAKEWDVDMLDRIAEALEARIQRPKPVKDDLHGSDADE